MFRLMRKKNKIMNVVLIYKELNFESNVIWDSDIKKRYYEMEIKIITFFNKHPGLFYM